MNAALEALRSGGKLALSRALADLERKPDAPETLELLDAAFLAPRARTLGLTGPPGVGKSTLADALIKAARAKGLTIGIIAVDPSSTKTGGALLGDRARLASVDPEDQGVFTRSMATRGRLGGLAALVFPAMVLMRAVYDVVLLETVGVGQTETEAAGLVDALMLCVQPGSGDSLQFMKAGIMEVPDLAIVTKSDSGGPARRAAADLRSALSVLGASGETLPTVTLCSAVTGEGVQETLDAALAFADAQYCVQGRENVANRQAERWLRDALAAEFGSAGLKKLTTISSNDGRKGPFSRHASIAHMGYAVLSRLDSSYSLAQRTPR